MNTASYFFQDVLDNPFTMISVILGTVPLLFGLILLFFNRKLVVLIFKNLGRNRIRTLLTGLAIMVLVFMVTLIWTMVFFLDTLTKEKHQNLKVVISERWNVISLMPLTYVDYLDPASPTCVIDPKDVTPKGFMYWAFYGGTLDPQKRTVENTVFLLALHPEHIIPMMDDLENLDPKLVAELKDNPRGCLVGPITLQNINKKVGDRFQLTGINYPGVDLEFEIVGVLPAGRYSNIGIMTMDYFNQALDSYRGSDGKKHPLSEKRVNRIWLRVKDTDAFTRVATAVENASVFSTPQVKCEKQSREVAAFLGIYGDMIWGMKWLLVPAILFIMCLIVSIAIGISVRERVKEIAVLKVLGFRQFQILILVLGESMLIGGLSGILSAGFAYSIFPWLMQVANIQGFPTDFSVPVHAFWWGLAMGFTTSFLGSFMPALTARSVKVSEVFARVA